MELAFDGPVVEWRGPAPYFFVEIPEPVCADIAEVAAMATYGWGVIPVEATIRGRTFTTSLFPKDGGYLLPLKVAVRTPLAIAEGDVVSVAMAISFGS